MQISFDLCLFGLYLQSKYTHIYNYRYRQLQIYVCTCIYKANIHREHSLSDPHLRESLYLIWMFSFHVEFFNEVPKSLYCQSAAVCITSIYESLFTFMVPTLHSTEEEVPCGCTLAAPALSNPSTLCIYHGAEMMLLYFKPLFSWIYTGNCVI